ncbi:MAG: hypothetical protein IK149_07195 [Oscillospiraceae bacterium]|nr:hypothetical protein [Oscillospiraceae bacterium]
MKSRKQKTAGQKGSRKKWLIVGLIILAVYEAVLYVIARRLLEKDLKSR